MAVPTVLQLNRQTWQVGEEIGCGGFAHVYAATAAGEPACVVKLIPKEPGADRELLFQDLGDVPNVMPIVDSGDAGDAWAIVMARADLSLADVVMGSAGQPLPPDEAIPILIDIATALAGLEERVVHRDLKPSNVLHYQDRWCLADFGISRYAEAATDPNTHKYAMTPAYAAPEQWRFEHATAATDVYAFGVLAFELLAGHLPFSGPVQQFRDQHLHEPPPPLPQVPPDLAGLVGECLLKPPQARPRPANILARLQRASHPVSEAERRLQEANKAALEDRSHEAAHLSQAEAESERRAALLHAAKQTLQPILDQLLFRVAAAAPLSVQTTEPAFPLELGNARLNRGAVKEGIPRSLAYSEFEPPFDVIAYTELSLSIPRNRWGYEGRAHSLWYCDAQREGEYRWYETAFMITPSMRETTTVVPFAGAPTNQDIAGALSPVMTTRQVAWPFTPIDQGEGEEFIQRWIGWFAEAAQDALMRPSHLPERAPNGSWRSPAPKRR